VDFNGRAAVLSLVIDNVLIFSSDFFVETFFPPGSLLSLPLHNRLFQFDQKGGHVSERRAIPILLSSFRFLGGFFKP